MENNQNRGAVLTVTEAARVLGIGRNLAYRLAQTGEIPAIRLGKRIIIPRAAFEQWLSQAVVNPKEEQI